MSKAEGSAFVVDAMLFDMDGTLVDSLAVVERAWRRFAGRYGLGPERVLAACHGRRAAETVALFAIGGMDVDGEVERLTAEEIADVEGLAAVPGAAALLAALPAGRWAVVTSASRALALRRLQATGLPVPPVLVTAEDVGTGKPAPDGYLAAASALGVAPADCLVLEDAPAGVQAGRAAGAAVVAVTAVHGEHAAHACADARATDLTAVQVSLRPDGRMLVSVAPPPPRHT